MAARLVRRHVSAPARGYETFRILSAYRRAQETLRSRSPLTSVSDLHGEQLGLTCTLSGFSSDTVANCVRTWFELEPLTMIRRFIRPGLEEFLLSARSHGVMLAVLSDYPANEKLRALGVESYFHVVACAQDAEIQCFKPDPAGLLHVLKRLNVDKENALYIGDRVEVDAEAARRAGIRGAIVGGRPASESGELLIAANFHQLQSALFS